MNLEKVKNALSVVVIFMMILIITINLIFIVQIYILKEEIPDIFGVVPLIFIDDGGAPLVRVGDFVFCQKVNDENLSRLEKGSVVMHFSDSTHTKLSVCSVVSVNGDTATLMPRGDNQKPYDLTANDIICSVWHTIPVLGLIIYFLSTTPGFFVCVVIPVFVFTELYLYTRKKSAQAEMDEESMLLAELESQQAERERLLAHPNRPPRKLTVLSVLGASIMALCMMVPIALLIVPRVKEKRDAAEARRRIENWRDRLAMGIGQILFAGMVFKPKERKDDRRK